MLEAGACPRLPLPGSSGLQQCLTDVRTERDATKAMLEKLRKAADFYRRSICNAMFQSRGGALAGSEGEVVSQLRSMTQAMESEVRSSTSQRVSPAPHVKAQEVVKRSLEDAQQRLDGINIDIANQATVNDELLDNLWQLKDANKRILEQLRFQTDELARHMQKRIGIEESMSTLSQRHASARDGARHQAQERAASERESAVKKYSNKKEAFNSSLQVCHSVLHKARSCVVQLLDEQQQSAVQARKLKEGFVEALQRGQMQVMAKCKGMLDSRKAAAEAKQEENRKMQDNLRCEQSLRNSQNLSWGQRHCELVTDKEDVQSRATREVCELTAQVQALERMLATERSSWEEERKRLLAVHDEAQQKRTHHVAELEQLERREGNLESTEETVLAEKSLEEQEVDKLRSQAREQDDFLEAAVSGNQHLRTQMDEQRMTFQEKNEVDVKEAQALQEELLVEVQQLHEQDTIRFNAQLQNLEQFMSSHEQARQNLESHLAELTGECQALSQEASAFRSRSEAERVACQELEKQLADNRKASAVQRLTLQTGIEQLAAENSSTELDIKGATDKVEELMRDSSVKETERGMRIGCIEAGLRDAQDHLVICKRKYAEADEARQRCVTEASAFKQRSSETQRSLQETLEGKRRAFDLELKRLRDMLSGESAVTQKVQSQLEQEQEMRKNLLKLATDESRSKVDLAQREKLRAEEISKADIASAVEEAVKYQRRVEGLEEEVRRMHTRVAESEHNLQLVRQELEREHSEVGSAVRVLGDEVRTVLTELEKAVSEAHGLSQQVGTQCLQNEQERTKLLSDLDQVWPDSGPAHDQVAGRGGDGKSSRLSEGIGATTTSLVWGSKPDESLTAASPNAFPRLQSELEDHLQRLQWQCPSQKSAQALCPSAPLKAQAP